MSNKSSGGKTENRLPLHNKHMKAPNDNNKVSEQLHGKIDVTVGTESTHGSRNASNIQAGQVSIENLAIHAEGTSRNHIDNNKVVDAPIDTNCNSHQDKPDMPGKKARVPYASLFKNNRMANADYKLQYMDTGNGKLKFGLEDIDSIENTYGICLLGYVISGKPPTAALFDLVRRWGSDIRFQTHESGWIVFTFPNVEARDQVLRGGIYMVFGYHLFLKEMPRCFRFREEDMNTLPAWVQIHGLPPDCWNFNILSKLASRVGNPIHMDMLTHERKRVKYARVLIEIEASKPKITEMEVELPIGDVAIKFEYEQDFKLCSICHKVGHVKNDCIRQKQNETVVEDINTTNNSKRNHSRSVAWRPGASRGRSRVRKTYKFAPSRPSSNAPANVAVEKKLRVTEEVPALEMVTVSEPFQESWNRIETSEKIDKGKSIVACEDMALPSTSCIAGLDAEGFKVVSNKKKQKKKQKNKMDEQNRGTNKEMTVVFGDMEDTSSCNTEYVDLNNINNSARYFGNQDMGPQPTIASGYK